MNNTNTPLGLHLVADFKASININEGAGFMDLLSNEILKLELFEVGRVLHIFEGGGFTAVSCLTESHLSVHTWPENSKVTFDVFLSNHLKINNEKAEALWSFACNYFQAFDIKIVRIERG